jgi:hypothetical protein
MAPAPKRRPRELRAGLVAVGTEPAWFCVSCIRTASHFARFASAERPDRLAQLFERLLGCLGAQCDCCVGAMNSKRPRRPRRGLTKTSGGSPASRARVMRSCIDLAASARAAATGTFDGHAFNNSRQGEYVPMLGKMARSAARCAGSCPPLASGLQGRRKRLIFTPVRESSGECRLNHNMMPMTMGTSDSAPLLSCSAC